MALEAHWEQALVTLRNVAREALLLVAAECSCSVELVQQRKSKISKSNNE